MSVGALSSFRNRIAAATNPDAMTPAGTKISKAEMEFALSALDGAPKSVKESASAWLANQLDTNQLDGSDTKALVNDFIASAGAGDLATATAGMLNIRGGNDGIAPKALQERVKGGFELAEQRDEVSFSSKTQNPQKKPADFFPAMTMSLDIDGKKEFVEVFVSKEVGLQGEHRTDDITQAHKAVVRNISSGDYSDAFDLAGKATAYIPEDGLSHAPQAPVVADTPAAAPTVQKGKLTRKAESAVSSAVFDLVSEDSDEWSRISKPKEDRYFYPPFEMTIDVPRKGPTEVEVYFSKRPTLSGAADFNSVEESRVFTIYDPAKKHGAQSLHLALGASASLADS